ncbi:hypothetical protein DHOM_05000 [Dermabacter hominis 1368]|uniref:ATP-binding protein n=1 Tax=Dermabacter hominis 1368 TaxID=1450519 RepID=A0ABR4SKB5_9MICO|nr:hypothetical protein DHOM_05000 [Dermabacter hominis 1368]
MAKFVFDVGQKGEKRSAVRKRHREVEDVFNASQPLDVASDNEHAVQFPVVRKNALAGAMGTSFGLQLRRLRVSSARFGSAIPFLADAGTGVEGARLGKNLTGGDWFHFDPWTAYQKGWVTGTSIVQIGSVGSGKSTTSKAACRRLIAQGRKIAVPSDPKGEWARVAETVPRHQVLELGLEGNRINPLEEGVKPASMDAREWASEVHSRRQQLLIAIISVMNSGRPMEPQQYTALDVALKRVVETGQVPTIRALIEKLRNPSEVDKHDVGTAGEALAHSLNRAVSGDLAGMFDQESTVKFDRDTQMIVISTRTLLNKPQNVRAVASACTSFWVDSVVRDENSGYWVIVSEEGWSEMRDPRAVELLDERQRLAGEFGLANWLIMHEITDLDMVGTADSPQRAQALGLLSKAQIKIVHKQSETAIGPTQAALRLSEREAETVLRLRQGQALWKVGDRAMVVETLITRPEWEVFNTSSKRAGV